jgi:predicted  nucleic acid-binding Zn-ribbon protein
MAVRHAASEYDRLEIIAREREQLLDEIDGLKNRLSALESEVHRLHDLPKDPP